MTIAPLSQSPLAAPPAAAPNRPGPLRAAAEAFETAFLAEMLKSAEVFKASESMGGGTGEEQFTSFLADEQARAMVARGGLGLADRIEAALVARQNGGA